MEKPTSYMLVVLPIRAEGLCVLQYCAFKCVACEFSLLGLVVSYACRAAVKAYMVLDLTKRLEMRNMAGEELVVLLALFRLLRFKRPLNRCPPCLSIQRML